MKDILLRNLYKLDLQDAKIDISGGKPKALRVQHEISASGKVTNGRIYPPKGHRAGVDSWTNPYPRPVLLHHDDMKDPIGRYVSVTWVDNELEALDYLQGDYKALADIKRAFDSADAKTIYKVMKKHNALDKKFPGLGKVIGEVRITDADAIEKFLDGRYLTWSAGQSTDAYICMSCNSDWRQGEFCDHSPGMSDEDGDPVYFLCGNMTGQEGSVVNIPANDTSLTLSMSLEDSACGKARDIPIRTSELVDSAPTVRSVITVENQMSLQDLQALEIKTVVSLLADEARLREFLDALQGDDHLEVVWLIRIHDALHEQWDYQQYGDAATPRTPISVYKLHGALHEIAVAQDFRSAMINGLLDTRDSAGAESTEYLAVVPDATEDSTMKIVLTDEQMSGLAQLVAQALGGVKEVGSGEDEETTQEVQEEEQQVEVPVLAPEAEVAPEVPEIPGDSSVDWSAVGRALGALVDAKPTVADGKYQELQVDYAAGLTEIQALKDQLGAVLGVLRKSLEPTAVIDGVKLDDLLEWFATLEPADTSVIDSTVVEVLKPTESPGHSGVEDHTVSTSQASLTRYQQQLVDKYTLILKSKDGGQAKADAWLHDMRELIPQKFDIKKHITG